MVSLRMQKLKVKRQKCGIPNFSGWLFRFWGWLAPGLDNPPALNDPSKRPYVHLNAGYLDGRVERFKTSDAIAVKNKNAPACLAPDFR